MAIVRYNGTIDEMRNSLGNITFTKWRDHYIAKQKNPKLGNENATPVQLETQANFTYISKLVRLFRPIFQYTFVKMGNYQTYFQSAWATNNRLFRCLATTYDKKLYQDLSNIWYNNVAWGLPLDSLSETYIDTVEKESATGGKSNVLVTFSSSFSSLLSINDYVQVYIWTLDLSGFKISSGTVTTYDYAALTDSILANGGNGVALRSDPLAEPSVQVIFVSAKLGAKNLTTTYFIGSNVSVDSNTGKEAVGFNIVQDGNFQVVKPVPTIAEDAYCLPYLMTDYPAGYNTAQ